MSAIKEFAKLLKEAQTQQKENKAINEFTKLLNETKENSINNIVIRSPERTITQDESITIENTSIEISSSNIINEEVASIEAPLLDIAKEVSPIEQIAKNIRPSEKPFHENIENNRWNDPLRKDQSEKFVTFKDMNEHYSNFINRIQQQLSSIGGGGEVNFRYLDDVNRSTMTGSNDNWVLEYNSTTGKVEFTNKLGPLDRIVFDVNHAHDEVRTVGTLCWGASDDTLNLEHPGGVTQQIGQELYAYVRNRTGSTIPNGTVVRFAGAEQNGTSRLLIAPFLGDGTYPSLYGLGITTQDIIDGNDGFVTVWGKVREVDTSAWNIGDILFVSANTAGELTNIKPTAPNNVVPFAAVLRKSATDGEIFVRPTIEQQKYYGRFIKTDTQTANTINTGYSVLFNDTEISNGVTLGTPSSRIIISESGFYQFDASIQVEATSNKGVVHIWYRKNLEDIPHSSRSTTVTNGDVFTIHSALQISLNANDYVEVMWATSAAGISLKSESEPIVGPAVGSVLLSVAQLQL